MKLRVAGGGVVELSRAEFVARGGEGSVYAKAGRAYKVYEDPALVLPAGKLRELDAIEDPFVIKPERWLRQIGSGRAIGYDMRYVADAILWCQLVPRSARERRGLSPSRAFALVRSLQQRVANIHRAAVTCVDLSELNLLVSSSLDQVYCIDVDSYQTTHYPATAIAESVRDPLAGSGPFDARSDWFSFAVVSFLLLIGIHPYKGSHPRVRGLAARMAQQLSVFDPAVQIPNLCYPLDVIPAGYRRWYRAVLQEGKRLPPPDDPGGTVVLSPRQRPRSGSRIELLELASFEGTVLQVMAQGDHRVVLTDQGVWVGGRKAHGPVAGPVAVGFTRRTLRPVLVTLQPKPEVLDLSTGLRLELALQAEEAMAYDGRIYLRSGPRIVELDLTEIGAGIIASVHHVADVLPHATRLYDGVGIQSLLGSAYALVFPAAGACSAARLAELDHGQVIDAKFDRGVLMALRERGGRTDRLVYRFGPDYRGYDLRIVEDVSATALSFTTLDSGVCVCRTEQGAFELSSSRRGSTAFESLTAGVPTGPITLSRHDGWVIGHWEDRLARLRMRDHESGPASRAARTSPC
ncbi:MAG: hypothetical protein JRI23_06760 [Deltaproteobacteria bacterium]|nr:hypothetical protein [Deltaproteobacteria bacterium]MBW2531288.1 hypothetical protein [Deltaproteobacteria bacterium]